MATAPRPFSTRLAIIISLITNPAVLVVVAAGGIAFHYASTSGQFWHWWLIASALLVGPSLLYSAYNWYHARAIDIDVTKRQDRVVPLLLATCGAIVSSFLIATRLADSDLLLMSYVLALLLVMLTVITTVWKISLHMATLTSLVTLAVFLGGPFFSGFYVLLVPVGWARRVMEQHTRAQLLGGVIIGGGVTASVIWLLGR